MLKNYFSIVLVGMLITISTVIPTYGKSKSGTEATPTDKIRASILKRGVGEKARVTIKRRDGTTLKGYINQSGEDSFTLTDPKAHDSTTLTYSEVSQVRGKGLSKGTKIAIAVGIGAAVTAIVIGVSIDRALEDLSVF